MKNVVAKGVLTSVFLLLIVGSFLQPVNAQSIWVQDYENEWRAGVEFVVPSYSFTADQRGVDIASYLYSNIPLSQKWSFQLVFPISRYYGSGSRLSSGNPFIGFQYINSNGLKLDFGARLPLIQQNKFGSYSYPLTAPPTFSTYRTGAFAELKTAVHFTLHYRWGADNTGWIYKVGQGLAAVAPTDGSLAVVFKYYGQILYEMNNFTFGGGLAGHILTNRDHYLYPNRNNIRLGLIGEYGIGRTEIGVYAKTASRYGTNFAFGFNFSISL